MPLTLAALKHPRQSLNKSYLKNTPVDRETFDHFKENFNRLLRRIDEKEREENVKNHLADFLKTVFYGDRHAINTKGDTDLVIHAGSSTKSPASILFETKKPDNKTGMISKNKLNAKAMQQLLLYYLRERENEHNTDIKYLIITNIYEFFIFEAADFEKLFYQNKTFLKKFKTFEREGAHNTQFFYESIAQPFLDGLDAEITATYFNIQDYQRALETGEEEEKLIALYLLLAPEHLLKTYTYDSNQLNQRFYEELLHIIGLEEVKKQGKKLIERKKARQRDPGSLLENTIRILESSQKLRIIPNLKKYGQSEAEQLVTIALELVITWINRILFLKLLEGQLVNVHGGDKLFKFLDSSRLHDFDGLYELFFEVLSKLPDDRRPDIRERYQHVPYLNSSLFEITDLERYTLSINALNDRVAMSFFPRTVLVDNRSRHESGETRTFDYLLRFLDAYDFSAEGQEKVQARKKDLISASVLGLIFEKLNGYRDGSFYTPGFITMYMARTSLRKTVLKKFNQKYGWNCPAFAQLRNYFDFSKLQEYNDLINSITVCDPAVGSGHFLVSVLNEFLAIKSDLGILLDTDGIKIIDYEINVDSDELVVTNRMGEPFEYLVKYKNGVRKVSNATQPIQRAIFQEKKHIIENCLYGVDINPNSVSICQLRLWIELLKHTFYTAESEFQNLEVLPNLDMKIMEGNSLIPTLRQDPFFIDWEKGKLQAVSSTQKHISKINESVETLRKNTQLIFDLQDAATKYTLSREIENAKIEIAKAYYSIEIFKTQDELHALEPKNRIDGTLSKKEKQHKAELEAHLQALKNKHFEMQVALYYRQTISMFDWKIMFSDILGTFKNGANGAHGFDIMIGNPPYIRQEDIKPFKPYLENRFETYAGTADLFVYFIELGMQKLREGGAFTYIVPNKWMRAGYGKTLREFVKSYEIEEIVDFGDLRVFTEATTYPCILSMNKAAPQPAFSAVNVETLDFPESMESYLNERKIKVLTDQLADTGWTLTHAEAQRLLAKLRQKGKPLGEYVEGKIFYGIKTGYNEAFVIDEATKNRLIAQDPKSAEVIKPFLAGRDIKRYQQPKSEHFLVLFRNGDTRSWFGALSEAEAWAKLSEKYPAVCTYLLPYQEKAKARYDQGHYWWELRACDYYEEFEQKKILWPGISHDIASFGFDEIQSYGNDNTHLIVTDELFLLGILNSSLSKFFLSSVCDFVRGGFARLKIVYVSQIPIPDASKLEKGNVDTIINQVLTSKSADPTADTSALEAEIDRLVYQLYGLSEEEIRIVEGAG